MTSIYLLPWKKAIDLKEMLELMLTHKKKLACLVAVSDNLAFAAGNIAISLNRYMKIDYDLLVYTSGMDEKDKIVLNSLPHTYVVNYEFDADFLSYMMTSLPPNCRFKDERKLMRFCHYEAFKLLEDYQNVVWIDADMSVQADLSPILKYAPFGITLDTPWNVRNQFIAQIEGFDMEKPAYCSGIMMLNEKLPYQEIYKWLFEKTKLYAPKMKNGDQAIINLMIQEFKLQPVLMPLEEYQCIYTKKEGISARVVHFGTDKKVWNDNVILNCYPEWYRVYCEWVALGGTPCESISHLTPTCIHWEYRILNERYVDLQEKYDNLIAKIAEMEKIQGTKETSGFIFAGKSWKKDSTDRLIHIEDKEDGVLDRTIHIEEKLNDISRQMIPAIDCFADMNTLGNKLDDLRTYMLQIRLKEDKLRKALEQVQGQNETLLVLINQFLSNISMELSNGE